MLSPGPLLLRCSAGGLLLRGCALGGRFACCGLGFDLRGWVRSTKTGVVRRGLPGRDAQVFPLAPPEHLAEKRDLTDVVARMREGALERFAHGCRYPTDRDASLAIFVRDGRERREQGHPTLLPFREKLLP